MVVETMAIDTVSELYYCQQCTHPMYELLTNIY